MVELVRDIYESSQAPIMLVGEEQLPNKLKKFERLHSRVLSWIPAQPVSQAGTKILASVYAPNLQIDADLLKQIVNIAHGSVRRITVNLVQAADLNGYDEVDLNQIKTMQGFEFYKGEIPKRGVKS
ncbi:hypothetical protein [Wielerella bovis]|uniref:hypothetical protein n=1 Tax=Wielerella bovis TaxID=2917790 RepID=UPI0020197BF1|nr:hypothetical protein [Wielerella bovis]ULJ59995.1 hypothetical protein MIS44_10025 [Wielerella bovis]